jgi:phosphotriesterase-related protein
MSVMTATGPVKGEDLGLTLVHEHIIVVMGEMDPSAMPDRNEIKAMAIDRLQELKAHGVDTFVDPCPMELGRDPELYAELSQATGVNIVFATGFYYEGAGLPAEWRGRDAEEIADLYIKELTDGVGATGLRPGIIKAATGNEVSASERQCLSAAAKAQRQSGAAIITHTEHSRHGDIQQDIFEAAGADLSRILIGHQDEQTSVEPIRALAKRGTFVGMDRIGIDMLSTDARRADHVAALVEDGLAGQVCLSQDCVCAFVMAKWPYPGPVPANPLKAWSEKNKPYTHILTDFVPLLKERGVSDADVDQMLRANPRRLLTGRG